MSGPTCSIVLPVYGRAELRQRSMRSALAQTMADIELIVVDDCSPEPVFLPADLVNDRRVRLIARNQNGGVAAAQNTGARAATGRFIGFLHSDDVWLPDRLRIQIAALATTSAGAVESGTVRRTTHGDRVVGARLGAVSYDDVLGREVRNLHISGVLFRTDSFRAIGGFDDQLRAYEDFDLLVRFTERFEIVSTDDLVALIDQRGADRLGESPWMTDGRRKLLAKYNRVLQERFGQLPPVWKDWAFRDALDLIGEGRVRDARLQTRRSIGLDNIRAFRRAPLFLSTFLGARTAEGVASLYRRRLVRTTCRRE